MRETDNVVINTEAIYQRNDSIGIALVQNYIIVDWIFRILFENVTFFIYLSSFNRNNGKALLAIFFARNVLSENLPFLFIYFFNKSYD